MTKDDAKHPAWKPFWEFVGQDDVDVAGPLEEAWKVFREGWHRALEFAIAQAQEMQKAEEEVEFKDKEKFEPILAKTPFNFSCPRCPDQKNPSPEFHTTGLAHTKPSPPDNERFANGQP